MTAARLIALAAACALALAGCSTQHPRSIARDALAEAQTFPYYKLYWVGPSFEGHPLAAADGLAGYNANVGDSVFYGDCVRSKGIFGGGSCLLPLQVTTVLYRLHSNSTLGPQHNILVRGDTASHSASSNAATLVPASATMRGWSMNRSTGVRCATPPDPGVPVMRATDLYLCEPARGPEVAL